MPNPYIKPYKINWKDRVLTKVGTLFIGSPKSITGPLYMDRDGLGDGFYYRPHTRMHLKGAGFAEFARLTARHGLRVDLTHRVAKVNGPVLAVASAVLGLIVAVASGVK